MKTAFWKRGKLLDFWFYIQSDALKSHVTEGSLYNITREEFLFFSLGLSNTERNVLRVAEIC